VTARQLESIVQHGDAVTVSISIESDDTTKKWWPADFRYVHRATFGPELILEIEVVNTGTASLRVEDNASGDTAPSVETLAGIGRFARRKLFPTNHL
jgi:hypothetical protein